MVMARQSVHRKAGFCEQDLSVGHRKTGVGKYLGGIINAMVLSYDGGNRWVRTRQNRAIPSYTC